MFARKAFTMIELIFVIVILGILAAVAIPRLAGTRDDAKESTLLANARTCLSDVAGIAQSTGVMPVAADIESCAAANVQAAGTVTIGADSVTISGTIDPQLNGNHNVAGVRVVR